MLLVRWVLLLLGLLLRCCSRELRRLLWLGRLLLLLLLDLLWRLLDLWLGGLLSDLLTLGCTACLVRLNLLVLLDRVQ